MQIFLANCFRRRSLLAYAAKIENSRCRPCRIRHAPAAQPGRFSDVPSPRMANRAMERLPRPYRLGEAVIPRFRWNRNGCRRLAGAAFGRPRPRRAFLRRVTVAFRGRASGGFRRFADVVTGIRPDRSRVRRGFRPVRTPFRNQPAGFFERRIPAFLGKKHASGRFTAFGRRNSFPNERKRTL